MNSRDQDPTETLTDPRNFTFSQAQRYEEIPGPLKLEELPKEARIQIWNVFVESLDQSIDRDLMGYPHLINPWRNIMTAVHGHYFGLPLDKWSMRLQQNNYQFRQTRFDDTPRGGEGQYISYVASELNSYIEKQTFNKVFDLIQFVMRHPECPAEFINTMQRAFAFSRLAYVIDKSSLPTVLPAVTCEEGVALLKSLDTLREAGLSGSAEHLRKASEYINQGDWAGSIRESIHAVESVARIIDPQASQTLGPALSSIERQGSLHPALKNAFSALYGYTSNEQGIRHALLNGDGADVGKDEAIFMIGACASFASYLWRKHQADSGG